MKGDRGEFSGSLQLLPLISLYPQISLFLNPPRKRGIAFKITESPPLCVSVSLCLCVSVVHLFWNDSAA